MTIRMTIHIAVLPIPCKVCVRAFDAAYRLLLSAFPTSLVSLPASV